MRGGDRVGIYFAETGASQRASTVIYDRAHSAISEMRPDAVDWDGASSTAPTWFHVTGITPALGASGGRGDATRAIAAARAAGARVSVDLNYRKKLWTEAQAQAMMRPADARRRRRHRQRGGHAVGARRRRCRTPTSRAGSSNLAGYRAGGRARDAGVRSADGGHHAAREPVGERQRLERGALGRGGGRRSIDSQRYDVRLVDRIGGGDSFAAGLIYGLVTGRIAEATRCASPSPRARSSRRFPATSTA